VFVTRLTWQTSQPLLVLSPEHDRSRLPATVISLRIGDNVDLLTSGESVESQYPGSTLQSRFIGLAVIFAQIPPVSAYMTV
jgi:hypothetical protein